MRRLVPLALYWFLSFCGFGIFFPFFVLYLRENLGLDGAQIGVILAIPPLIGLFAQPLWGYAADRSGARRGILILVTAGAALGYALLTLADSFATVVAATAATALFVNATIPLALSVTFAALHGMGPHAFGLVRVWGTIGYLLSVTVYPWLLHRFAPVGADGIEPGLRSMFLATGGFLGAAALVGPWLPSGGAVTLRAAPGQWRALLHEGALVRLLLFTFCAYLFLQGPMGLFSIYVRQHSGDMGTVGRMWVMMLVLEIPLILLSGAGLQRIGARGLLAIGTLAGGVRWTTCALTDDLNLIYAAQLLHGAVVTGVLLGGPLYLERVVPDRLRSTAQGMLSMVGVGIGSIISNTASGWLLEHGGVDVPFLLGGLGGLALGCAAGLILPRTPPRAGAAPVVKAIESPT